MGHWGIGAVGQWGIEWKEVRTVCLCCVCQFVLESFVSYELCGLRVELRVCGGDTVRDGQMSYSMTNRYR